MRIRNRLLQGLLGGNTFQHFHHRIAMPRLTLKGAV
jgi:hypothetical protein